MKRLCEGAWPLAVEGFDPPCKGFDPGCKGFQSDWLRCLSCGYLCSAGCPLEAGDAVEKLKEMILNREIAAFINRDNSTRRAL